LLFIILSLREQSIGITIILACIGFILPDYLVKRSNRRDNEDMMPDIKVIYDTLRIQTKAGVFINEALGQCYLKVRNERLKEALLILNGKLIRDKDIELAIQDFNDKFDNPHIDSLCAIIKSGLESGKTLKILEDVTEQLEDISEAGFRKEENEIERQVTYLQLMVYVGVIATSFFIFYLELINSVSKF
ncbi:MAG: type II secretion system F family protein, partial [Clostridium paraputrificum]